jgi:hypothetical protein
VPPRRIGERPEDEVVVGHVPRLGDRMVTCQAGRATSTSSKYSPARRPVRRFT